MLSMGFSDDLDAIFSHTPDTRQTLLFSATMPKEIRALTKKYMHQPETITIGRENSGAKNVEHIYYGAQASNRYPTLKRLCDIHPSMYAIVFCRTRRETKEVADRLMQDGYNADALHGDLSQSQRDYVMQKFRNKSIEILVATDVAARGIDVNSLTHVINYNLPDDIEAYVHRSGRTGRAGNKGQSLSIVHSREMGRIRAIERMSKIQFEHKPIPTGEQVCEAQLFALIDTIKTVNVDTPHIGQYLPHIYETFADLDRDELIARVISIEFNRFLQYYKNAPDLNINLSRSQERKPSQPVTCLRLNIGRDN